VFGADAYDELVEPHFPEFVSSSFERLCQRAVLSEYGDVYTFTESPGRWWDTDGREIDIVAPTNGDTLLVGEAKFQQQPTGYDVLAQLEREAPEIGWSPTDDVNYEYALFSRSGFTSSVEEAAEERDDSVFSQLTLSLRPCPSDILLAVNCGILSSKKDSCSRESLPFVCSSDRR
jgi:hypothetical protein